MSKGIHYDHSDRIEFIRTSDWDELRERLKSIVFNAHPYEWFPLQRALLAKLGLEELAGYDGPVAHIIDTLGDDCTYEETVIAVRDRVVGLLRSQILRGGPTLLLDAEKMMGTSLCVLVPMLLEARLNEIEKAELTVKGSSVFLYDLWMTSIGFRILKALEMSLITDGSGLIKIQNHLKRLGLTVRVRHVEVIPYPNVPNMSSEMRNYILALIGSKI
ncbi:MAG: hypothetical protein ACXADL_01950 [Candidatus Thorarchaeota archaeon]